MATRRFCSVQHFTTLLVGTIQAVLQSWSSLVVSFVLVHALVQWLLTTSLDSPSSQQVTHTTALPPWNRCWPMLVCWQASCYGVLLSYRSPPATNATSSSLVLVQVRQLLLVILPSCASLDILQRWHSCCIVYGYSIKLDVCCNGAFNIVLAVGIAVASWPLQVRVKICWSKVQQGPKSRAPVLACPSKWSRLSRRWNKVWKFWYVPLLAAYLVKGFGALLD